MNDVRKRKIRELRETIFWQQLNKQLIEFTWKGKKIKEEYHSFLQRFSFDNNLFSKITGADLLDEIPLTLITDFSGVCFLNLKMKSWNDMLTKLIPQTFSLNIERALADAFVAAEKNDKYFTEEKSVNYEDEEDEELYEFIDQYLTIRKQNGRNLPDMINGIFGLKSNVINGMMNMLNNKFTLIRKDNRLCLGFPDHKKRDDILRIYIENFCRKGPVTAGIGDWIDRVIKPINSSIMQFLYGKRNTINLKPSIKEFIDHEVLLIRRESEWMQKFGMKAEERQFETTLYEIGLCSLSPFAFLEYPFPEV